MVEALKYDDGMLVESRFGFVSDVDNKRHNTSDCLRFLDLQLNSVGTRKYTGQKVDSTRWPSRVGWFLSRVF